MKKYISIPVITLFVISGCILPAKYEESGPMAQVDGDTLIDIATGEEFRITDFDKPILLESFAVWCPTCRKQQEEIKALHEDVGDTVVSISLDTDPNEEEEIIQEHIDEHGFDWYFAISPVEFTQSLIDEYGVNVVNAPSAPVVLICNEQSYFLESGVKKAEELKAHIEDKCN